MKQACPVVARQKHAATIFVCRKCQRRAQDGKAIRNALKSELRDRAKAAGHRKPRLVATGCLKICPKRSMVVANGALLAKRQVLLVDAGSVKAAAKMLTDAG